MLVDIGHGAFYGKFPLDPHPFLSGKFIQLNSSKAEKVYFLVDDNNKQSIGLIVGVKSGCLISPFSAPFGGFHFQNEFVSIEVIKEFILNLQKFINQEGLLSFKITLPPNIYHQTFNSKLINCFFNAGFAIDYIDITNWINLEVFNNWYSNYGPRKCLNQAIKHGLKFRLATLQKEKIEAFGVITRNRQTMGRPIYMSFSDLEKINNIWEVDFFIVQDNKNNIVAASINYRFHQSIVYAVFWGDNENGRSQRAMDFCVFNLLTHYKESGFKLFDIGISTLMGIPNEGLVRFKEIHEGISSTRFTFSWSNVHETELDQSTKKRLMEPFYKYGIILRLVVENDAEFILNLRTDPKLRKYISATNPDLVEQINWIKNYKVREKEGKEYYFIAQDQNGNRYGTIRLYNRDKNSFEIGSWLFAPNSPMGMAVKAHVLGYEIGFEYFKADLCKFDVRKGNHSVLKYVEFFRPQRISEDDLNVYFNLTKENFYQRKDKLSIFSSSAKTPKNEPIIHSTSEVQSKNIGEGTVIWQHCVVLENAVIGKNCNLNYNVFVENDVIIGDNVTIKSGVQLWDGIRLEDNVFISPNVTFTNDFAPRSKQYPSQFLITTVKEGASIGANSTIIGGISIGRYAMIGAGSMVTKNIPDFTLWYGNPAIMKAYICKCGQKLNANYVCPGCQLKYALSDGALIEI